MSDEHAPASSSSEPTEAAASSSQEPTQTQNPSGESSSTGESSSSSAAPITCTQCRTPESEAKPLKPCSKCQTALYCSRDCQKAHFKVHKKTCAKDAQIYALKADLKPSAPPRAPKENFRGGLQKWQFDT